MRRLALPISLLLMGAMSLTAGVVEEWNAVFINAIQAEATPPCLAARNLAILHIAIHDAINAVEPVYATWLKVRSRQVAVSEPQQMEQAADGQVEAAAVFAAYTVAQALYPARAADFDSLLEHHRKASAAAASPLGGAGADWGGRTAQCILDVRENDGSATTEHYVPLTNAGAWRRPPSNRPPEMPAWGRVALFCLERPGQFCPDGPPDLNSQIYAEDVSTVREMGGATSSTRSAWQTETARFWADFSYTSTPPGHWNDIARDQSLKKKLPLHESARLFALLNVAMADTGIAVWECKYKYNFWRPHTAIAAAITGEATKSNSGSPRVAWKPLLNVPPHPEYVSGHSAFSGAAAAVLEDIFGHKDLQISARSHDVPGVVRTYSSFSACAEEIGLSRVWGGIHFPSSCRDGHVLGTKVAQFVLTQILAKLPAVEAEGSTGGCPGLK